MEQERLQASKKQQKGDHSTASPSKSYYYTHDSQHWNNGRPPSKLNPSMEIPSDNGAGAEAFVASIGGPEVLGDVLGASSAAPAFMGDVYGIHKKPSTQGGWNPTSDGRFLPGPKVLHWWYSNSNTVPPLLAPHNFQAIQSLINIDSNNQEHEEEESLKMHQIMDEGELREILRQVMIHADLSGAPASCCRGAQLMEPTVANQDKVCLALQSLSHKLTQLANLQVQILWNCEGPLQIREDQYTEPTRVYYIGPAIQIRKCGAIFPQLTQLRKKDILKQYKQDYYKD